MMYTLLFNNQVNVCRCYVVFIQIQNKTFMILHYSNSIDFIICMLGLCFTTSIFANGHQIPQTQRKYHLARSKRLLAIGLLRDEIIYQLT